MKTPKGLKLKLKGDSRAEIMQMKVNSEEKEYFNQALSKLNEVAILKFTMSDLLRMSMQDLTTRILNEKIIVSLDIPERKLSFDLAKTQRS